MGFENEVLMLNLVELEGMWVDELINMFVSMLLESVQKVMEVIV